MNTELIRQYESEWHNWYKVLQQCLDVLIFLCERGLPIRGDKEMISLVHNGNYLGVLELLSRYDSLLAAHLQRHSKQGNGNVTTSPQQYVMN